MKRCSRREFRQSMRTLVGLENLERRDLLAIDTAWVGGASGTWSDGTQWSNGVPTPGHSATVSAPGSVTIEITANADAERLSILNGITTINLSSKGLLLQKQLKVGASGGAASNLILNNGHTTSLGDIPDAILVENGSIELTDDAPAEPTVLQGDNVVIAKPYGSVTVNQGTTLNAFKNLSVGHSGFGDVLVKSGGKLNGEFYTVVGGYNRAA